MQGFRSGTSAARAEEAAPGRRREEEGLFDRARNAADEIVQRKGYTNFAVSPALARTVGSILRAENSVFTVSSLVGDDRYGQADARLIDPSIINRNGILRHIAVNMDEAERDRLHVAAEVLKETARRTIDG